MSDKLESVLIDAIQKTQAGIGDAVDFAVTQSPEVIQQLLMWKAIESVVNCVVGLLCFAAIYLFVRFVKNYPQPESFREGNLVWWDKGELNPTTVVFGGMGIIALSICGIFLINITWLKIWIAPNLYLVEYAASMIK